MSEHEGPYARRQRELAEQYHWKAENIVRFLEKLKMTTAQKEDFVAKELARAYEQGMMNKLDEKRADRP